MRDTQPMADPLIRRDAWSLQREAGTWHPIMRAYALAVGRMQQRPPNDETSWTFQAEIHATDCQHNTWYFLPWHRMYIYWFERVVRAAALEHPDVPDDVAEQWALPYWNYDGGGDTARLPDAFREPQLENGDDNPLFTERRSPRVLRGEPLDARVISARDAMREGFFALDPDPGETVGFGGPVTGKNHFDEDANAAPGGLEMTPHNDVHVAVGGSRGLMVNPLTAAYDPIFWLHHANVDRLWVEWLGLPGRENPTESAWSDETFPFHDEEKNEVSSSAATVVDLGELGYEYEEVEVPAILAAGAEEGSPMPTERPPDHPPELVGATAEPLSLSGQEERVPIELGQPSGPALLTDEGPVEPERVYVNVEGVEADENPGVVYGVYVNLPDDQDPDTADRFHIGNLSFFGVELAGDVDRDHRGGPGLRYAFDISELVTRLRDEDRWNPEQVTVTFSPLGGSGDEPAAEQAEGAPSVKIGRVGIYYQ
jgi:tyrosinase